MLLQAIQDHYGGMYNKIKEANAETSGHTTYNDFGTPAYDGKIPLELSKIRLLLFQPLPRNLSQLTFPYLELQRKVMISRRKNNIRNKQLLLAV